MNKHTILFLAANPNGTDRRALDREARSIQLELERSGHRECFEFVTRWAVEPLDILRELRKLRPTVVHFSGRGARPTNGIEIFGGTLCRDVNEGFAPSSDQRSGLFLQGAGGQLRVVSTAALKETFASAGGSVKLVILNACYSAADADALITHIDHVVGISGSIDDDAARSFSIGFYGGLGERESVAAAYRQGCAAIGLEGFIQGDRPQLRSRNGADPEHLMIIGDDRRRQEAMRASQRERTGALELVDASFDDSDPIDSLCVCPALDLKLLNRSAHTIYVKRVDIHVLDVKYVSGRYVPHNQEYCATGLPRYAEYELAIPVKDAPFFLSKQVSHVLKADEADRIHVVFCTLSREVAIVTMVAKIVHGSDDAVLCSDEVICATWNFGHTIQDLMCSMASSGRIGRWECVRLADEIRRKKKHLSSHLQQVLACIENSSV